MSPGDVIIKVCLVILGTTGGVALISFIAYLGFDACRQYERKFNDQNNG